MIVPNRLARDLAAQGTRLPACKLDGFPRIFAKLDAVPEISEKKNKLSGFAYLTGALLQLDAAGLLGVLE